MQWSDDEPWRARGACRGTNSIYFFGPQRERREEQLIRETTAKSICMSCPSRLPCMSYAIDTAQAHGVWGGLTEVERRSLRSPSAATG